MAAICSAGSASDAGEFATQIERDLIRVVNDLVPIPTAYASVWLVPEGDDDEAPDVRHELSQSLTVALETPVFNPDTIRRTMPGEAVTIAVASQTARQPTHLSATFLDSPIRGQFIAVLAAVGRAPTV